MYRETFKSPFWGTKQHAESVLCEIRTLHSEDKGWHEEDAFIEERINPNSGEKEYRAVRTHYKDD